jgi:predicted acyl esterase
MKDVWYRRTTTTVQHGLGTRGAASEITGELVAGPETLSDEELERNRSDFTGEIRAHPLDDEFHRSRSARLDRIVVPFLSAGNWGGSSLHLRGNVEAFSRAASADKWLEIHTGEHWAEFYTNYGVGLQKAFFDHFLKGDENDWRDRPRVTLRVRTVDDGFVERFEDEWPIARTRWTRRYLDLETGTLAERPPRAGAAASFDALEGDGITVFTPELPEETEITGPVAAKLFVSSSTTDADLFLVLRVFAPDGEEVVFRGAVDPHTPVGHGWLRASHRKLDPEVSTEHRPYHAHDEVWPLVPGEVVELDVEIWPTSVIVPPGYRIGLTIRGRDYEWPGAEDVREYSHFKGSKMRGVGIYTHEDPTSRPREVFGGTTTLHAGGDRPAYLLLPVVPSRP